MKLPIVSGDQIIKMLEKEGFQVTRQKGNHGNVSSRHKGRNRLKATTANSGNVGIGTTNPNTYCKSMLQKGQLI